MRRVPAVLIAIFIACPLLWAAFLVISLSSWTMDRHFYLDVVNDLRLYEIPADGTSAGWPATTIQGSGGLQWQSVRRAAREVLTPDYLRGQTMRLVNQVFDSLEGKSPHWNLSTDLVPLKLSLRGEAGAHASRLLAEDLPVGGGREGFRVTPGHLPVSRPSSMSVVEAAGVIQAGIPTFLGSVPDTLGVSDEPGVATPLAYWSGPRFPILGWLLVSGLILLALGAGALTAAAFVGSDNARERLLWYGWPLLVPAACALLLGLSVIAGASVPWLRWALSTARLEDFGFSPAFISAVLDAVRRVVVRVGVGFLATGGVATGAAFGLLAWSWGMPRRKESA